MRLFIVAIAWCLGAASNASAADIKSISRLATGPENVLFVADWKSARVHAITLPPAAQKPAGTAFNILDLEDLLSRQLGGAKVTVWMEFPSSGGEWGLRMSSAQWRRSGSCQRCASSRRNRSLWRLTGRSMGGPLTTWQSPTSAAAA
jgi:hypothetical protein